MGNLCNKPAVLHDYQPTWQRQRVHEDADLSSKQMPTDFGGEELLLPVSRQPLTLAPTLGRVTPSYAVPGNNGTTPGDGRNVQSEDVEQTMPVQLPTTMTLPRGPVMLPVNEPIQWIRGDLIGAGAFGRVYAGLDEATGQLMAVKQVLLCKDNSLVGRVNEQVVSLEKEVAVLKQLDHPNIVRYLGTERTDECLNIFLEFVPGGSIASLINKFGSLKESVLKIYARQILTGLEYLHQHQIMHRDIKGANILVDNTGLIKLADFGASKKIEDLVTLESNGAALSIKGTPYWMAPEVIKQSGHGRSADIWSVACTIIEMATGKPPWSQFSSQVSALFHIASSKGPPPIPEHLSPEAKDFLLLCFNRVPKERPNATRLLKHPWLADTRPRTLATPLTNISMESGPLGFRAPNLLIPSSASPVRGNGAPPISPIEEEPEGAGSLALSTGIGGDQPGQLPVQGDVGFDMVCATNPYAEINGRGSSTPKSTHLQGANSSRGHLNGLQGHAPTIQIESYAQASNDSIAVNSPEPLPPGNTRMWDSPTFGFGLQSAGPDAAQRVVMNESSDSLVDGTKRRTVQLQMDKENRGEHTALKNGLPRNQIQAIATAEMPRLASATADTMVTIDQADDAQSSHSSMESGSYNPVEEPSWMQSESYDLNVQVNGSDSTTPRCRDSGSSYSCERMSFDLRPSRLSMALPPGESPDPCSPKLVDSPHMNMSNPGADEAELNAYVQKKVLRSSRHMNI
eukprot:jgi/Botrbrau1/6248/Bobra.0129s0003.2